MCQLNIYICIGYILPTFWGYMTKTQQVINVTCTGSPNLPHWHLVWTWTNRKTCVNWIYIFVLDIFCQHLGDIWQLESVCAPFGRWAGKLKNIKKNSMVSNCTRCQIVRFYTWCQIVRGVKLSWCQIVRCQIVLVSNCPVSNCPRCQIVRCQIVLVSNCPPTWAVSNCPRCQIVLVSNCPGTVKISWGLLKEMYGSLIFNRLEVKRPNNMFEDIFDCRKKCLYPTPCFQKPLTGTCYERKDLRRVLYKAVEASEQQ